MAIQIEVISTKSVTKPTKNPGKTYTALEVAYKNLSFQGKVEGRSIMSFGATADTFKTLSTAQTGEIFDIEVVKNAGGYNDWVSAKKSVAGAGNAVGPAASSTASSTSSYQTKSTYETPEERAKKQIYIVRQSSISSAIDMLSVGAKSPPKLDDVIDHAAKFEAFVFGSTVTPVTSSMKLEDLPDSEIE